MRSFFRRHDRRESAARKPSARSSRRGRYVHTLSFQALEPRQLKSGTPLTWIAQNGVLAPLDQTGWQLPAPSVNASAAALASWQNLFDGLSADGSGGPVNDYSGSGSGSSGALGGPGAVLYIESGATLQLTSPLADNTVIAGEGTLDLNGQQLDNTISLVGFAGTLTNSSATTASFAGAIGFGNFSITGGGNIDLGGAVVESYWTMSGTGAVTLSGTDYSGAIDVESGTVQLNSAAALTSGTLTINNGTLDLNGQNATIESLSGAGGEVINSGDPATLTLNSQNGASSYYGTLDGNVNLMSAGNGYGGSSGGYGGSSGVVAGSGGDIDIEAGTTYQLAGTPSEYTLIEGSGTLDLNGQFADSTVTLEGFTGTIINSSSDVANLAATIQGGQFTVAGSGDIEFSGTLSQASITKTDGNTLLLCAAPGSAVNSLTMSDGTVQLSSGLSVSGTLTINGGTLDLNGQNATVGSLTGSGGQVVNSGSSATLTLSGQPGVPSYSYNGTVSSNVVLTSAGNGGGGSSGGFGGLLTVGSSGSEQGPIISDFLAEGGLTLWSFSGRVTDPNQDPAGLTIAFGGLLLGQSTTVDTDGTFLFSIEIPANTSGTVTAQTVDNLDLASNLAWDYLSTS